MLNKHLISLLFLTCFLSLNAQKINNLSDFFRNKNGQIKIGKNKQARLKILLGSNFNCVLECCTDNLDCSVSKISSDIIIEIEQTEKEYNNRYQKIAILKWRNSDSLAKLNLNLDTINYYSNIVKLKNKIKEIQYLSFSKGKISTYLDSKLYENSDLKKYVSLLNDLSVNKVELLSYEEKLKNWEKLLEPIEEQRKIRVLDEWHQFIKNQMLIRWDIETEKLEKERLEKIKAEEEEKRRMAEEEKLKLEEEQKFYIWKNNLRFSINYKLETVEIYYRCNYCEEEWFYCIDDEFPELDFSNYTYPEFMKQLWKEHKNKEGAEGWGNSCFLSSFGGIISGKSKEKWCNDCGRKLKLIEKRNFLKKTFKN